MAGMRALGRVYDVVVPASGVDICLKDCSGVGLIAVAGATATGTLTFTAKPSFGGTAKNVTPANGFGQPATWYSRTANTAAWVANAASWSTNVLTIDGTQNHISYVDFLVSQLADTYDYLNVTAGTAMTLWAVLYDLTVQRTPANLRIPSA
jgi:hypothetical protein